MIIEEVMTLNRNGNTFTPNLGDKDTFTSNLEDRTTWIPNLEDTNLHLINAIVQFLNREKEKNKDNSEFISKVNDAISNLSAAFLLADYSSNQLQVHDNIEQIFYLAVRYDLLKAHVEGFAKNTKQSISNTPENVSMVPQENGSDKESNNEESVSIDDTINHENTAELNNKAGNTKDDKFESDPKLTNGGNKENNTQHELISAAKDKEMDVDPGERIQVFLHCDVCKKTFNEEIELKEHKEDWRVSSWSCGSGARFPEKKYCGACKVSYSVRDTFEHQKRCIEGKSKERVNTLSQKDVLTTHKRAHPDAEKESQNEGTFINNPRSKISKKNNVEENIITEIKEEHDDNNCSIDIKEETIEEEGDPLSSVDPSLPGNSVQVDPSLPGSDVQVDPSLPGSHVEGESHYPVHENNQQYSEVNLEMTKGLKRVIQENTEILTKVENTESSISTLKLQIEQILKYSIANHGKLKILSQTLPAITTKAGKKTWSNVTELEQQLKEDKNNTLRDHLFVILRKVALNNDDAVKMDKKGLKLALNFIFQSPEEAILYTALRGTDSKPSFISDLSNVYKLVEDVCCEGTGYSKYRFKEDVKNYFQNINQKTPAYLEKAREKKKAKKTTGSKGLSVKDMSAIDT